MTVFAIAIVTFAFIGLRTALLMLSASKSANTKVLTFNKISMTFALPLAHKSKIQDIPQVKSTYQMVWFGGAIPGKEQISRTQWAVDHESFFDVEAKSVLVDESVKRAWKEDRQGLIIIDHIAEELGVKVGDTLIIDGGRFPAPVDSPWTFHVVGIYPQLGNETPEDMFFHYDYFNEKVDESFKNRTDGYTTLTNGVPAEEVAVKIDNVFANDASPTRSTSMSGFMDGIKATMAPILRAIDAISIVLLVLSMAVVANAIALGARERTREFAVMRAIGFSPFRVARLVVFEGLFIGALGALLGVGIFLAVGAAIKDEVAGQFPEEGVNLMWVPITAGIVIAVSALSACVPGIRAGHVKVIEGLRHVG